ncbi:MAG TPA: sigma-54 dependent transcriptional regulator [Bryobacteraceae bacterium]|nr:sigma-54 dependent transcriptional regulator [Bryobacteraceae bacterium]
MRQSVPLLWVRSATFGPSDIALMESLDRFDIQVAHSAQIGMDRLASQGAAVIFAEFPLEGWDPAQLLESIQGVSPRVPVVIRDPEGTVADAVRLVKLGAYHFMSGTLDENELFECLDRAAENCRWRMSAAHPEPAPPEPWKQFFIGDSRPVREVEHMIRLAGPKRSTVLIGGETGTGKEVVARALHRASPRAHLPMVAVNCSALPANLLEAELFGHVKGAFTGALQQRTGRFEQAHNSTLFLDEVGELPLDLQAKLLRVLQEREFQRVGSSETVRVDVRIIAASNTDLREKVVEGAFREDLFYRLNVVPIHLPALRERVSDIPLLVHHFLEKICRVEAIEVKRISRETLDRLCSYSWPGNVRQLENAVEMAVVLSGDRMDLCPADFPVPAAPAHRPHGIPTPAVLPEDGLDFEMAVANFQRTLLEQAMRRSGGNKTLAADLLRMKRTTLLAKLRNLDVPNNVIAIKTA